VSRPCQSGLWQSQAGAAVAAAMRKKGMIAYGEIDPAGVERMALL